MRAFIVPLLLMAAATAAHAADFPVADFGAKGDGQADDGPAIQRALDAAARETGGRVLLNARSYRLDTSLVIPSGVTLAGTWETPHFAPQGSILLATANRGKDDAPALIRLRSNSAVRGLTVFYPDQRLPDVIAYPWTIQGAGTNCSVTDVTLVNPVKGIDVGSESNELHYIRNVFGCPLQKGVYIDRTTDIGRVENVHFNPNFWTRSGFPGAPSPDALIPYLGKNCIAFDIGRSDWEFITNTFSFGCKVGYRFFESEAGPTNGNFVGIAADWATTAVLIEQTQAPGLLITNGEFVGNEQSEACIEVAATHTGVAQFNNCAFWGPMERVARVRGGGYVQLSNCNFVNWDPKNKGIPAIEVLDGSVDVSASNFIADKQQISLGPNVTATVQGNHMVGAIRIANKSKLETAISGNVARKHSPSPVPAEKS
jgi:hypothetical protein